MFGTKELQLYPEPLASAADAVLAAAATVPAVFALTVAAVVLMMILEEIREPAR